MQLMHMLYCSKLARCSGVCYLAALAGTVWAATVAFG